MASSAGKRQKSAPSAHKGATPVGNLDDCMDVDAHDVEDDEDRKAPPIYTCWVCREELTEHGPPSVECCATPCGSWACMTCVDISSDATAEEIERAVIYCDAHDDDMDVEQSEEDMMESLEGPKSSETVKVEEEDDDDDDDDDAREELDMMEGPRASEAKATRSIPGVVECLSLLKEAGCLNEKMENKLRRQFTGRKDAAATAYQHLWTAMLTAELWRAQDLLNFCIITGELRQFLQGKIDEGVNNFSIGRAAIGGLAPEAVALMAAVKEAVEDQLNDPRLKDNFFQTKKDGKGQHKTVLFDLAADVGETTPDIRVDFNLFEILKCLALGLPSIMATVKGQPLAADCEVVCDLLGVPKIYWARVRQYRAVQWCVIVILIVWRYGVWPERSGLALVHVAREGELYLAEDKQQRDSSKGGEKSMKGWKEQPATEPGFHSKHQQDSSTGGAVVPENSERKGRGVGSRQAFVLVQCKATCPCIEDQLCTCGRKCVWQYQGIAIQNSQPCQDSCVKDKVIDPGEPCPKHVRQVQRKKRPESCTHAKAGIQRPDLFNGTVLATSDTAWPGVPLLKGDGSWVVPYVQGGKVVIP